jgi:hypothetical protein
MLFYRHKPPMALLLRLYTFLAIILIKMLDDEVGELSPIPAMNRDNDVVKRNSDSFLLRGVVNC